MTMTKVGNILFLIVWTGACVTEVICMHTDGNCWLQAGRATVRTDGQLSNIDDYVDQDAENNTITTGEQLTDGQLSKVEDCLDKKGSCWFEAGKHGCHNRNVKRDCPLTCKVCRPLVAPKCTDRWDQCKTQIKKFGCLSSGGGRRGRMMRFGCQLSCNLCTTTTTTTITTGEQLTDGQLSKVEDCFDKKGKCWRRAGKHGCHNRRVKRDCPLTCKVCTPLVAPKCADRKWKGCSPWHIRKYGCTGRGRRGRMARFGCPLSCKMCTAADDSDAEGDEEDVEGDVAPAEESSTTGAAKVQDDSDAEGDEEDAEGDEAPAEESSTTGAAKKAKTVQDDSDAEGDEEDAEGDEVPAEESSTTGD